MKTCRTSVERLDVFWRNNNYNLINLLKTKRIRSRCQESGGVIASEERNQNRSSPLKLVLIDIRVPPDESGGARGSPAIDTAQREKRLLNGLLQNLLPAVGPAVRSMVLAYSSTVSSKMVTRRRLASFGLRRRPGLTCCCCCFQVRQILSFCPNIRHLDLTQTDVTDCAFDR